MKKIVVVILILTIAFLLVSCGKTVSPDNDLISSSFQEETFSESVPYDIYGAEDVTESIEESSTLDIVTDIINTVTNVITTSKPVSTRKASITTQNNTTQLSTTSTTKATSTLKSSTMAVTTVATTTTRSSTTITTRPTTTTQAPTTAQPQPQPTNNDGQYLSVTVDELYSNPQKYNGKNVEVNGYITFYGLREPYYGEHFYDICITTNRNSSFDVHMYDYLGLGEHDTGTLYLGFEETNTPYVNGRIKVSRIKSNMAGSPQIDASGNLRDYPIKARGAFSYNPQDEHYISDPYTYQLDISEYYLGR